MSTRPTKLVPLWVCFEQKKQNQNFYMHWVKISNLTKLFRKTYKFYKTFLVTNSSNFIKLLLWKYQIWQSYFMKFSKTLARSILRTKALNILVGSATKGAISIKIARWLWVGLLAIENSKRVLDGQLLVNLQSLRKRIDSINNKLHDVIN